MKFTLNNFNNAYTLIKNSKFIKKTPLVKNERLSNKYNCNIFFKREDLQIVRSFKIRGAYNKIMNLENKTNNSIITASAGNHACGLALTCNKLKLNHHIFLPETTPLQKINRIKYFGGNYLNLHFNGKTFDESYNSAKKFGYKNNLSFVHPFDDNDVIIGQGTIAKEIYDNIDPNIIICPIGGGGLISGIGSYSKLYKYNCKIFGVEAKNANAMKLSIENNSKIILNDIDTFVDGASLKTSGDITFDISKNVIDNIFQVSNNKLCYHMIDIYQNDGIILEPAGALSIAILDELDPKKIKNKNIICILSGGNNDITRYPEILEKSLIYQNLKHYFIIQFSQTPGQLKLFINNILGKNDDITRFEYLKKTNKYYGSVLLGLELQNPNDIKNIILNMQKYNIKFHKIDEDNLLYSYLI